MTSGYLLNGVLALIVLSLCAFAGGMAKWRQW